MHVSARAVGGTATFDLPMARRRYLIELARASLRYGVIILFFVIMRNHVHLLVWGPSEKISRTIQLAHGRFARWVNEVTAGQGHVFQARFDGRLVTGLRYLVALIRYLARNPVEAGAASSPAEYVWSADRYYRHGRSSSIIDLGAATRLTRLAGDSAAYRRVIDGPQRAETPLAKLKRELDEQALLLGVTPGVLCRGREPEVVAARARLMNAWLAAGGSRAQLARVLGLSRSSISRQAR